ncbi:Cell division protein FtsL [Candidatus Erwinia haradaeae]|uniref:Cell division protein FtsL n=1 Tax=Candidatus Erwinia haradaeae TaxID=1922217 RepID=A0A451CYT0_9GAMM|nr:cell division protein FtsL [Candidatus Erwinia haradaeae]VFP78585.1 Cell division protein FtsL [Candidatus Erwinia haradaeae]
MTRSTRCSLSSLIAMDLIRHSKIPIFLLIVVVVSSFFVVITAYKTRLSITEREKLILECDALDTEWRNLILEENALSKYHSNESVSPSSMQMNHYFSN